MRNNEDKKYTYRKYWKINWNNETICRLLNIFTNNFTSPGSTKDIERIARELCMKIKNVAFTANNVRCAIQRKKKEGFGQTRTFSNEPVKDLNIINSPKKTKDLPIDSEISEHSKACKENVEKINERDIFNQEIIRELNKVFKDGMEKSE